MSDLHDADAIGEVVRRIDGWLEGFAESNPAIAAVDRNNDGDEPRWYVRMIGEEKEFITVWLTLGQRTLRYEADVMPAPAALVVSLASRVWFTAVELLPLLALPLLRGRDAAHKRNPIPETP